nr:DUF433 domain-containing protein [Salinibacter sp.]
MAGTFLEHSSVVDRQMLSHSTVEKRCAMFGFDRVTFDSEVMAGRACIRDTRVPVSLLVNLVANGMTPAEIIESYPYLEPEDIQQALQYAAYLTEEKVDSAT